jgi:prephenate dehydrogenase
MKEIKTVGIIGLGSFGKFIASLIPSDRHLEIMCADTAPIGDAGAIVQCDLRTVAAADVVILAIPLTAYDTVLRDIKDSFRPETVLIDACSVKVKPEQLIDEILPSHPNLLLTHPLFGPLTVGRRMVVTKSRGQLAEKIVQFCEQSLGIDIYRMSSEEHDKAMAQIHVLSLFVARGLSNLGLQPHPIATPTYRMLMELVEIDRGHTEELFLTVQEGNPFADIVRKQVVKTFTELEVSLHFDEKPTFDPESSAVI